VLAEQDAAEDGDVGQKRNVDRLETDRGVACQRGTNEAGKPEPEEGERDAGHHLTGGEALREDGEDERHQHADNDSSKETDKRPAGPQRDAERGHRSHHHHAFDAEIEDAGALDHELADRRDEKRRGGGDAGEDQMLHALSRFSVSAAAGR
jgi:hypothetical protein